MNIERAPASKAAMLIRRPVPDVFEAFVNPAITTKFWFSRSSGMNLIRDRFPDGHAKAFNPTIAGSVRARDVPPGDEGADGKDASEGETDKAGQPPKEPDGH